MKIGLNLYSIRNLIQTKKDLIKTLKQLKKDGLDFVQFSGSPVPLTDLLEASRASKMPILLTHVPVNRVTDDLDQLIKEHQSFRCSNIGISMLDKPIYLNEKKFKAIVKKLDQSAKKLKQKNMKFFYHNHAWDFIKLSSGETAYDYMINHAPNFNFTFDIYWAQFGGVNVIDTINRLKGRIDCVHLKDYMINKEYQPEFAPLGDGVMNLKKIVQAAKKAGCKYFFIEQDNAAIKKDGYKDIVKSIRYIKENF